MNKNVLVILIAILVIIVGMVYFSQQPRVTQNNQPNQPSNNDSEVLSITIQNFSFNPAELNVKKGSTVTWINQDSVPHKISGGGFQSSALDKGQSFSFTFDAVGTFDYVCSIHPSMKGKIIVQ